MLFTTSGQPLSIFYRPFFLICIRASNKIQGDRWHLPDLRVRACTNWAARLYAVVHYLHAIEWSGKRKKKSSFCPADTGYVRQDDNKDGAWDHRLNSWRPSDLCFFSSSAFVVLSSFPVWKDSRVPETVWKKSARWLIRSVYLTPASTGPGTTPTKDNWRVAFCCWAFVSRVRSGRECISLWVLLPSGSVLRVMTRN